MEGGGRKEAINIEKNDNIRKSSFENPNVMLASDMTHE